MYGRDEPSEHSESDVETTQVPQIDKPVKTYSVLPPPDGYVPEPFEEHDEEVSSDSSSGMVFCFKF